ncbi:MAG TPA: UDP-N-acetylmuramoylalanyl-D-glutamyl-2,6-diaminopimelate--D-alanyl-D-alanine ligase [Candidatus Sulfotelmatobacter sp.]|jgi:UDP-N-acetylmuramoyl-tripeptide--D-alanyl-D-alanine ligase|nr:UDP-N-acetylmuramoylalanyl-D-glutamyl-2,6-diaminopimelate--D-alanyl-D-alanine ligase [Candidatus Sulfotelmatobacter sp.]
MIPLWTQSEALAATSGKAFGPAWEAFGVSIDSRSVGRGDLFVALTGPNHDGHDYVAKALADGATAALVHKRPDNLSDDAPLILVNDTLEGLRALAAAARARSIAKIVGVTGSVGKTSSKEMLKLALEAAGPTHASVGSFNNHWGVPLSLARLPKDAQYAVFELGTNHPGEIVPLTTLVRPHVAVITTVEAVHMEFFASTAEIAEAKAEIFEGVTDGGIAILPRDNRHYAYLRRAAEAKGIRRVESFGSHIDATARLLDCAVDPTETVVFALFGDQPLFYRVGVPGRQWAVNSLAVLQAAAACGVPLADAARALSGMQAPKGRGQRRRLNWDQGAIELIDESYNASPVSMRAAIATLAAAKPGKAGRRIAVLGDMLELGDASAQLHAGLAEAVVERRIDIVFTAGPLMRSLHDALPSALRGEHAADADSLASLLKGALKGGDIVMVKGSAGSRMGRVVQALNDASAAFGQPAQS